MTPEKLHLELLEQSHDALARDAAQIAEAYLKGDFVPEGADDLPAAVVGVIRGDLEFLLEVLREAGARPVPSDRLGRL